MTSSIHKSSSIHSESYLYKELSESCQPEKFISIADAVVLSQSLNYCSHVDRLFEKTTINPIYVDPPSMAPDIETRLFLLDITRDCENVMSNWESCLKKLDMIPQSSSTQRIRKLLQKMADLSRISREISHKRHEFQKG